MQYIIVPHFLLFVNLFLRKFRFLLLFFKAAAFTCGGFFIDTGVVHRFCTFEAVWSNFPALMHRQRKPGEPLPGIIEFIAKQ